LKLLEIPARKKPFIGKPANFKGSRYKFNFYNTKYKPQTPEVLYRFTKKVVIWIKPLEAVNGKPACHAGRQVFHSTFCGSTVPLSGSPFGRKTNTSLLVETV
jgi:hypothetical protein